MGGELSKSNEEALRAQICLLKSCQERKSSLEYELSSLKIKENFERFNSVRRTSKELVQRRKTLSAVLQESIKASNSLKNLPPKEHGLVSSHIITETLQELKTPEILTQVLSEDISEKMSQTQVLVEKLQSLKKTLMKKRKRFEKNRKKIEKIQIVTDLCEGKQKSSDLFSALDKKEINRIDSISTQESCSHSKHFSSIPMEFSESEIGTEEKMNCSMVAVKKSSSKKLKKAKKMLLLPRLTLFLRSKMILKEDLEKTVFNRERKVFKSLSRAKRICFALENVVFALETDPERYLKQLKREIVEHENEIYVEICKKEYYESVKNNGSEKFKKTELEEGIFIDNTEEMLSINN